jgi:hypothetical protein
MIKAMLCTVGFASSCALSQASAQPEWLMDCNELTLRSTLAAVEDMTPGTKKTEFMKHLDLAKEMMAKNDMAACKTHLNEALASDLGKHP